MFICKIRSFNAVVSLIVIFFRAGIACEFDIPGIMMSVQFADPNELVSSPQATEFVIPLYANCDDYINLAGASLAGGSKPVNVISASFPGDAFGFSSTSTEELLDQKSLNAFLESISALGGVNLDVDTAMSLYNCFVTGIDGTRHFFDSSATLVFPEGLAIEVESYQCIFGV